MRVFSCNPCVCSSKSSLSFFSPCSVKFEDGHSVPSSPSPVTHIVEEELSNEKIEAVKAGNNVEKVEVQLKSSLKRPAESSSTEMEKRGVKWMDCAGKELVEIREFECSDSVDSEDNGNPACICVIQ